MDRIYLIALEVTTYILLLAIPIYIIFKVYDVLTRFINYCVNHILIFVSTSIFNLINFFIKLATIILLILYLINRFVEEKELPVFFKTNLIEDISFSSILNVMYEYKNLETYLGHATELLGWNSTYFN
jgi:prepilin signal peptidase PulO-like enzyme (type II secretory pathway)